MLEHSIAATAEGLDEVDRASYRRLMEPIAADFELLVEDFLAPLLKMPKHPLLMARFGLSGALPATALAAMKFKGARAKALFGGMAAHSVQALDSPMSAAVGLVLMAAGHTGRWPILRGGAQTLTDLMVDYLRELGGAVVAGVEIESLDRTAGVLRFAQDDGVKQIKADASAHVAASSWDVTLADVTPRQLVRMAGGLLPEGYRRQLEGFRYGAGVFKVDYALNEAIPWTAKECLRAATVHVGGSFAEIVASEQGFASDRPFVLLVQPSLFDQTRAPAGKHTAWAYCHVPNGSEQDWLPMIERQIERFAPGFQECVLARSVMGPVALEQWNPNLVGGDVAAGDMSVGQLLFRPTRSAWRTPVRGLYLCGASTPPGGGVHGMCGYWAGKMAVGDLGIRGRSL
jgi:phytoene dehydrogenase-like protein